MNTKDKTRQDKTRQDKTRHSDYSKLSCQVIGDLFEKNGYGSAGGRIYNQNYLAPCIGASHFQQVKYIVVLA